VTSSMSSADGKRHRPLSADERVLWTAVTKSVEPLRETKNPDDIELPEHKVLQQAPAERPGSPVADKKGPPPLAPLGRRMRARVARGHEAIDGRLDLHGLTQSDAHTALLRFLQTASDRGARLVLVITGKGARGAGGHGVLKRQVPQWLTLP